MENKNIQDLIKILKENELTEIKYKDKKSNTKVTIKSSPKQVTPKATKAVTTNNTAPKEIFKEVKSTHIGNFYFIDKEGKELIKEGQTIEEGQRIGTISTVGVETTIRSPFSGTIAKICVTNGELVDYNKLLVEVK